MRAILALATALALTPLASSNEFCEVGFTVAFGTGEPGTTAGYFDFDCTGDAPPCYGAPSFWIYEESNGVAGLQRGGMTMFGDYDSCQAYPVGHDQGVF